MLSEPSAARKREERAFPDIVLKSQYFDAMGGRALSSEQRLMLAVLADAINLVQEGGRRARARGRDSFAEARNWIFRAEVRGPLSFENVCDALRIDAGALRTRLKSMIAPHPVQSGARIRLHLKEHTRFHRMAPRRVRPRRRRDRP